MKIKKKEIIEFGMTPSSTTMEMIFKDIMKFYIFRQVMISERKYREKIKLKGILR